MSIPPEVHVEERRFSILRIGVPAAVGLIVFFALLFEQALPSGDLHLSAPDVAIPGQTIGVRAWFFEAERIETAAMRTPSTAVSLLDDDDRVVIEVQLHKGAAGGLEGQLRIPPDALGRYWVRARAVDDGRAVEVRRALLVTSASPPAARFQTRAMQESGPLKKLIPKETPQHLELRVQGGACVAVSPCKLWVWVGRPRASLAVVPVDGVRADAPRSDATAGLVAIDVEVQATEARVDLLAYGPSGLAATRRVKLPLRSGGLSVRLDRRALHEGDALTVTWSSVVDRPIVVDLFHDGIWARALSFEAGTTQTQLHDLAPGLWRVQVRSGIFSTTDAAPLDFVVVPTGVPLHSALRTAAAYVLSHARVDGLDPFALELQGDELPANEVDDLLRYLFARRERATFTLPSSESSRLADDPRLEARRVRWRLIAGLSVLVIGLLTSGFLFFIGMKPSTVPSLSPSEPTLGRGDPVRVALLALAVLLLFSLIAAITLWRGLI